jgi:tetratricopeptide (TPR) repeat protein
MKKTYTRYDKRNQLLTMIKLLLSFILLFWFALSIDAQVDPLKAGNEKLLNRNFEGAIQDFNKILVTKPDNVEALCGRAEAKFYMANYVDAMKDAEQAANIDASYPRAYVLMGDVLCTERFPESVKIIYGCIPIAQSSQPGAYR